MLDMFLLLWSSIAVGIIYRDKNPSEASAQEKGSVSQSFHCTRPASYGERLDIIEKVYLICVQTIIIHEAGCDLG